MKRFGLIVFAFLLLAVVVFPQTAQHGIALSWNVVAGSTGYNVYESLTAGGPYAKLTTSPILTASYLDVSAADGKKHCYVVTDLSGTIESLNSNEVCATAFLVLPPPVLGVVTPQ